MKILRPLILALAVAPSPGMAGRYELTKGHDLEVCVAYRDNLNSFNPRLPSECERKINPEAAEFTKPDFKRLTGSAGLTKRIDEFLWTRDANPAAYFGSLNLWRSTPEQRADARRQFEADRSKRGLIGHLTTRVDIDNDDVPDTVYLDRACGVYSAVMLVLNEKGTAIDREKTKLVTRHPASARDGRGELRRLERGEKQRPYLKDFEYALVEHSLYSAFYDVFRYKQVTYFDLWWRHYDYGARRPYDRERLRVFRIQQGKVDEVCTYRFEFVP